PFPVLSKRGFIMKQPSSHTNTAQSGLRSVNTADGSVAGDLSPQSFTADFGEATHDLLMDESTSRRAAAAQRLADLGRPLASPYLVAALADNSWEVRQAAAEALGQIGESEAIAPLQDLLDRGNQDALLQQAISGAIKSILRREVKSTAGSATVVTVDGNPAAPAQPAQEVFPSNSSSANERDRVAAIEANLHNAEVLTQQRIEREKQLAVEIEALRKAEAAQLRRIEEANAESRRRAEEESRRGEEEA